MYEFVCRETSFINDLYPFKCNIFFINIMSVSVSLGVILLQLAVSSHTKKLMVCSAKNSFSGDVTQSKQK